MQSLLVNAKSASNEIGVYRAESSERKRGEFLSPDKLQFTGLSIQQRGNLNRAENNKENTARNSCGILPEKRIKWSTISLSCR